jgi:hypothetical protein
MSVICRNRDGKRSSASAHHAQHETGYTAIPMPNERDFVVAAFESPRDPSAGDPLAHTRVIGAHG